MKVSFATQALAGHGNRGRVWVVEDEPPIRHSLEVDLSAAGYQVRADADARGVRTVVDVFRPDLVVLDVRLPVGPDGLATAKLLRDISNVGVLFLTAADSISDRLDGFEAGADDYMIKPFFMAELEARIRALLRRTRRASWPLLQAADVILNEATRTVTRGGEAVELTKKEFDVLAVFLARPDQVISKLQLLAEIGRSEGFGHNLVEVHVSALRRKLEVHGPRILHTVRGVGYMLQG